MQIDPKVESLFALKSDDIKPFEDNRSTFCMVLVPVLALLHPLPFLHPHPHLVFVPTILFLLLHITPACITRTHDSRDLNTILYKHQLNNRRSRPCIPLSFDDSFLVRFSPRCFDEFQLSGSRLRTRPGGGGKTVGGTLQGTSTRVQGHWSRQSISSSSMQRVEMNSHQIA